MADETVDHGTYLAGLEDPPDLGAPSAHSEVSAAKEALPPTKPPPKKRPEFLAEIDARINWASQNVDALSENALDVISTLPSRRVLQKMKLADLRELYGKLEQLGVRQGGDDDACSEGGYSYDSTVVLDPFPEQQQPIIIPRPGMGLDPGSINQMAEAATVFNEQVTEAIEAVSKSTSRFTGFEFDGAADRLRERREQALNVMRSLVSNAQFSQSAIARTMVSPTAMYLLLMTSCLSGSIKKTESVRI
jgi:hypothetical protein